MKPVIKFPRGFAALKGCPGYFWNTEDQLLYSLKSGKLRPLKLNFVNRAMYNTISRRGHVFSGLDIGEPYYQISNSGNRKTIFVKGIEKKIDWNHTIPVQGELI